MKAKFNTWVEPDPTTAPLVARLFEEAATGRCSMPMLADLAEELGLSQPGTIFTSERLLSILKSPFYKGVMYAPKWDIEVRGNHEPLVSEELWDRVQLQLAVRGKAPYRTQKHKHLLRGLVKCICGMAMTAEFHDGGRNTYLRCVSSANRRYEGCGRMGPRMDKVVSQIEDEVLPTLWVSDSDLEAIRGSLHDLFKGDNHGLDQESHALHTKLAHLKKRSTTLLDMRLDGEIDKEEYQAKKASLEMETAKATKRLEQVEAIITDGVGDVDRALEIANKVPELWAAASDEDKRAILEAVFVRFVIDDKRVVESVLRPPYNWIADAVGRDGVEFVADAINVNGSRSSGRQQSDVWR